MICLANLKLKIDKLDITELGTTPDNFKKLNDVVDTKSCLNE